MIKAVIFDMFETLEIVYLRHAVVRLAHRCFFDGLLAPQTPSARSTPLQPEKNAAHFSATFYMLRNGVDAPGLCLTATPWSSPIDGERV